MPTVNIYEAKTQLSKLVDMASEGTDVVIARNGKPVARLTAVAMPRRPIDRATLEALTAGMTSQSPGAAELASGSSTRSAPCASPCCRCAFASRTGAVGTKMLSG